MDNISNEDLDKLKKKYSRRKNFKVLDDRKDNDDYFLLSYEKEYTNKNNQINFTFIWIANNIWQYRFANIHCTEKANWINPSELLKSLLDGTFKL